MTKTPKISTSKLHASLDIYTFVFNNNKSVKIHGKIMGSEFHGNMHIYILCTYKVVYIQYMAKVLSQNSHKNNGIQIGL